MNKKIPINDTTYIIVDNKMLENYKPIKEVDEIYKKNMEKVDPEYLNFKIQKTYKRFVIN